MTYPYYDVLFSKYTTHTLSDVENKEFGKLLKFNSKGLISFERWLDTNPTLKNTLVQITYSNYVIFCKTNKYPIASKIYFGRLIPKYTQFSSHVFKILGKTYRKFIF